MVFGVHLPVVMDFTSVIYAWCSGEGRTAAAAAALRTACWITFLQLPRVSRVGVQQATHTQWHSSSITLVTACPPLLLWSLQFSPRQIQGPPHLSIGTFIQLTSSEIVLLGMYFNEVFTLSDSK